jgi:hypothetical protein
MFESARLTEAHTLGGFDCGKESLNTWLIGHARRANTSGVAHVYMWTPLGEQKVSAYFAICPHRGLDALGKPSPHRKPAAVDSSSLMHSTTKHNRSTSTTTSFPSRTASVVWL